VQSQERLRALAKELNLTEQRERQRLAADLHDHLAQMLVVCRLKLSQAKRIPGMMPACSDIIAQTEQVLDDSLRYTRTLVTDLSPPVLQEFGLPAALKWLSDYMERHELAVTVDVPDSERLTLPEDQAVLLFQSVRELLINASKHTGCGKAFVALRRVEDELSIEVRDEGRGFDLAADSITVLSSKFGLFSIRERMKAMGGRFEIHSAPGRGTTATLILPLAESGGRQVASDSDGKASGQVQTNKVRSSSSVTSPCTVRGSEQNAKVRILLVDDHAMVRQGLRSMLDSYADIEVVGEAANGEEAVIMAERLKPAVVLMDINMPKKNGIEATAEIKAQFPSTIVIGLSVQSNKEARDAMLKAGARMLLTKESAVDLLYLAIHQAVSNTKPDSVV
jgi:CheY-like chemotaxis protein/anti-sigma regulatory factor (Ser/Thr protein kinase)